MLISLADPGYRAFQGALIPSVGSDRIIGIRVPVLRNYAKSIKNTETAASFLEDLPHRFYDEDNLHAILIGYEKDYARALGLVENFLPFIDNWATCDMLAPKALQSDSLHFLSRIREYLSSERTYTVRFGLVRLLSWYLDEPRFSPEILELAANAVGNDYYVMMAKAWFFSIALIKQYDLALPYLTENRLDIKVHNKAIAKARESFAVSKEVKDYLFTLRRRDN